MACFTHVSDLHDDCPSAVDLLSDPRGSLLFNLDLEQAREDVPAPPLHDPNQPLAHVKDVLDRPRNLWVAQQEAVLQDAEVVTVQHS